MRTELGRKRVAPDRWLFSIRGMMEDINRILTEYLCALRATADKPGGS